MALAPWKVRLTADGSGTLGAVHATIELVDRAVGTLVPLAPSGTQGWTTGPVVGGGGPSAVGDTLPMLAESDASNYRPGDLAINIMTSAQEGSYPPSHTVNAAGAGWTVLDSRLELLSTVGSGADYGQTVSARYKILTQADIDSVGGGSQPTISYTFASDGFKGFSNLTHVVPTSRSFSADKYDVVGVSNTERLLYSNLTTATLTSVAAGTADNPAASQSIALAFVVNLSSAGGIDPGPDYGWTGDTVQVKTTTLGGLAREEIRMWGADGASRGLVIDTWEANTSYNDGVVRRHLLGYVLTCQVANYPAIWEI